MGPLGMESQSSLVKKAPVLSLSLRAFYANCAAELEINMVHCPNGLSFYCTF